MAVAKAALDGTPEMTDYGMAKGAVTETDWGKQLHATRFHHHCYASSHPGYANEQETNA